MELQECLTEASGECRCRLCDSTLCTGELSSESGEEVVLCLLGCEDRYGRQNAESVCRKEDYVVSSRTGRDLVNVLSDLLDVIDRIGNTCVLCNSLISEVDLAVCINSYVFKRASLLIAL